MDGYQNADPSMNTNNPPPAEEGRRPFTSLSQEEADLALARLLQQQERAYMMLTGQGGGGYDDDGDEDASDYEEEGEALDEDAELGDGAAVDLDPARFMALAGFGRTMEQDDDADVLEGENEQDGDGDPEDAWEDIDPDEYSYEELVALGEVVGTESKGLSADTISSLPSVTYQAQDGNVEQCVICRVELEGGESLVALPCKHPYHPECIDHWLRLNKACPVCGAEVPASVSFNGKD